MEVGWNICSIKHQVRLPMRSDRLLSLAYKSPTRGRSLEAFPSTDTRAPQTALQVSATPREASTPKVSHLRPRPGWVIQLEPRETGSRQAVPSCSSVWDRIDATRWQRPPGKGSISTAGLFFFFPGQRHVERVSATRMEGAQCGRKRFKWPSVSTSCTVSKHAPGLEE